MGAFHEAALDFSNPDIPNYPEDGVGRSGLRGPWQISINYWGAAAFVAASRSEVTIMMPEGREHKLKVTACKVLPEQAGRRCPLCSQRLE